MAKKTFLSHEEYERLKNNTIQQSYGERFKVAKWVLYFFSWFGNAVSVFLAFFFIKSLFDGAFVELSNTGTIAFGIILFLSLFELLKRYVFSLFSIQAIKEKNKILRRSMFSFIISVLILISGSFYFSLNGAQRFVDKEKQAVTNVENIIEEKKDSLNNYYNSNYIKPLLSENKTLTNQNQEFLETSQKMYATRYTRLIEANNEKIKENNQRIERYEKQRDEKIEEMKEEEQVKLNRIRDENSTNILVFILISSIIEIIIMVGIYFSKFYDYKIIKEYEELVMNKPQFQRWSTYDTLIDTIFEGMRVGDDLPSADVIKSIVDVNEVDASNRDLENFFKMCYHLNFVEKRGSKRTLSISPDKAKETLRKYYKIV